ncbi:uncharacterized protein At4g06744-like [Malania oleifera]|uniref:uncharacterized protein At4g06744-like n=1 Tax=Malania oleifera TaxID=397392 RepID=UPI0025AE98DE|nr:uncharacterized protein At4g06744-like [Malania oleifera]
MRPPRVLLHVVLFLPCFLYWISPQCSSQTPPPPPSLIPATFEFLDARLAIVYPVIQAFKAIISSDPHGVTQTWTGPNICNYTGFFCDHPPDNLSAIALAAVDFNGFMLSAPTLVGFLDALPDISVFHANSNRFLGILPPNLRNLPYLSELDLSNNIFTGVFPDTLLAVPGLTFLDLRYNLFAGPVPPQIFASDFIDVVFLNNNLFTLTLPTTLSSTPARYLTFANNKFVGPIPQSIGNLSESLVEVLFLNNHLTGCIPYEVGFLKIATVFDVGNNLLTGPLPCSLGCMEKAEVLNFAGNQMYGQVPEAVCRLPSLKNLSLSSNYFTHVGYVCLKLIWRGVLDVRRNCIPGLRGQRSPMECFLFWLKPKFCLTPWTYNFIPCKRWWLKGYAPPRRGLRSESIARVTYSALHRHRLAGL